MLTSRHVTLRTQLATALPAVSGDRVQLQQLVLNLIVNATDAMADLTEAERILTISTSVHADAVSLCVADQGPGITTSALGKLFEPFWTTKANGMGMGLAICRSIADVHRGNLAAANAPGGGAVFCARLPVLAST
jgi:two-component system sensor histidine kinase DctS